MSDFTALLIHPDGPCVVVRPANGETFSLEELRSFVGGDIQIVNPPSKAGAIIVLHEEGKLEGFRRNEIATRMWQQYAEPGSPRLDDDIVGTILLCHQSQIE